VRNRRVVLNHQNVHWAALCRDLQSFRVRSVKKRLRAMRGRTLETVAGSEGPAVKGKVETARTGGEQRGRSAGAELLFLSGRATPGALHGLVGPAADQGLALCSRSSSSRM